MASNPIPPPSREWRTTISDQEYLISTDQTHLSHDFIKNAYNTGDMYWAKPVPDAILRTLLSNSLVLGLYAVQSSFPPPKTVNEPSSPETPSPTLEDPSFYFSSDFSGSTAAPEKLEQIGMARFVTDHVTVFYLTDVYVERSYRGKGIGKWLVECCRKVVESKPHLMRLMLMTSPGEGKKFYEEHLGVHDIQDEIAQGHLLPLTRKRDF